MSLMVITTVTLQRYWIPSLLQTGTSEIALPASLTMGRQTHLKQIRPSPCPRRLSIHDLYLPQLLPPSLSILLELTIYDAFINKAGIDKFNPRQASTSPLLWQARHLRPNEPVAPVHDSGGTSLDAAGHAWPSDATTLAFQTWALPAARFYSHWARGDAPR